MAQESGAADSERFWAGAQEAEDTTLPAAAMDQAESAELSIPLDIGEGMLPRDIQRKTAYYDYAAEKQLSHADAKLFYQRSQLESQKAGGSNWGNSQASQQGSPIIMPRSFSHVFEAEQAGLRRSGSVNSAKGLSNGSQRFVLLRREL